MKLIFCLLFANCLIIGCNNNQEVQSEEQGHSHDGVEHFHRAVKPDQVLEKELMNVTEWSPEYIQLATNVEIIPNIMDSEKTVGVLTHEGEFGPLLFGESIWSFFIDLKPGMFLEEHPHATESLVYTVSGKWVLCSEGKRQVMEAGSSFHFGSNMPTGWEAPFPEGAFLLIVKNLPEGLTYKSDVEDLRKMKEDLDKERAEGTSFYFNELDEDHPAIVFARKVSPDFDGVLAIKY